MADNFTSIFGGQPEGADAEQPIAQAPAQDGDGVDGGPLGPPSGEPQPFAVDGGPLGPPTGQPEPYAVDGGPLGPPTGEPEPYDAGF